MNPFYQEIFEQPTALRQCIEFYEHNRTLLASLPRPAQPVFLGMGASYHAAWAMSDYAHSLNIPALALEAADTLNYSTSLLRSNSSLTFVSQSGKSAEVAPIIDLLPEDTVLIGITNDSESLLAQRAQVVLPIMAGVETTVATKTYINTLALLWLMMRQWAGLPQDMNTLKTIADQIDEVLKNADTITARWLERLSQARSIVFLGHGPHAATARQAAMMVNEWAKLPASSFSIGAFRHGFIESSSLDLGVVIFSPPAAKTHASALALADELRAYGARVYVECRAGYVFTAPLLDIIPAQLFAEVFARHRGIEPGFRFISKVITRL